MNKQEVCALCKGPLPAEMDWSICDDCFRDDELRARWLGEERPSRMETALTVIAFIVFTSALCVLVGACFALAHVG